MKCDSILLLSQLRRHFADCNVINPWCHWYRWVCRHAGYMYTFKLDTSCYYRTNSSTDGVDKGGPPSKKKGRHLQYTKSSSAPGPSHPLPHHNPQPPGPRSQLPHNITVQVFLKHLSQTGHKSVKSLWVYERVTESQRKTVSSIVSPNVDNGINFNDE